MRSIFRIFKESTNSFDGQEFGEMVLKLVRRHPFYIAMKFVFSVIVILVPLVLGTVYAPTLYADGLLQLAIFLFSIWILLVWIVFFYQFTMYTLDVWIVTDRRIIDSTQHGFFNRTTSELHMTRVQDTSVRVDGFMQSLFHFGDVQVETAGKEELFKFIQIPDPEGVKDLIMKTASTCQIHP